MIRDATITVPAPPPTCAALQASSPSARLTAIRPLVMIAGVVTGIYGSHLWETSSLGPVVLALMLSLESALNHLAGRRQSAQIEQLT